MEKEKIWKEIAEEVEYYTTNCDARDPALVFNVFPGGGKTTTVIETLSRKGREMNFIYLSPTHKVIDENLTWHPTVDIVDKFVHFKSRKYFCTKHIAIDLNRNFGIPISPFCKNCENRKNQTCMYYHLKHQIERDPHPSWAGVHAHITTYLRSFLEDNAMHYDVLVLEENPLNSLMENESLDTTDIRRIMHYLRNFADPGIDDFREQLDLFHGVLETININIVDINHDRLYGRAVAWREFPLEEWILFEEEFYKHVILELEHAPVRPPKFIIGLLTKVFFKANKNTIKYHFRKRGWVKKAKMSINYFNKNSLKGIPLLVIGLDGTANIPAWESMLGKPCREKKVSYKYNNVYQLNTGMYYVSSWLRGRKRKHVGKTGRSLLDLAIKTLRKRPGKTVLFGSSRIRKPVMEAIEAEGLANKARYAMYYSNRSSNSYKDCDTVILLMLPNIPQDEMEVYVNLSGMEEKVWENYFIKDEMIQSLARIRPSMYPEIKHDLKTRQREPTEIYIYPKKKIFSEGDIEIGKYYLMNKAEMAIFLITGKNLKAGRNDKKIVERLLKVDGMKFKDMYNMVYPYQCYDCNAVYINKRGLENHLKRGKPLKKNNRRKSDLKKWINTLVHSGMLKKKGEYYYNKEAHGVWQ